MIARNLLLERNVAKELLLLRKIVARNLLGVNGICVGKELIIARHEAYFS